MHPEVLSLRIMMLMKLVCAQCYHASIHDNLLTCILCRGANNNVTLCTANVQLTCCLKSTSYPRFIQLCLRTFNFEVTATEIMYAWKGQELAASSQINYRCFPFRSLTCSNRPCFFFPSFISINCLGRFTSECFARPYAHSARYVSPFDAHYTSVMERSLLIETQADYD